MNVSLENAQRLGVVPAFWELGVVTLHGTEVPRDPGREDAGDNMTLHCRVREGVQSLPGSFYLGTLFHTGDTAASLSGRCWHLYCYPSTLHAC